MAIRQPLTPLGLAVLGLLCERAMHPYEMYQLLIERREERLMKIRPGSLYHAVARLEEAKLVVAQGTDRAGNRPERTIYEIAPAGREMLLHRLSELLSAPAEEYPAFLLAIAEAHNIPLDRVLTLLSDRRSALAAQLEEFEAGVSLARSQQVPRRWWLDAGYSIAVRTAELAWLDQLLVDLETGELPWQ